jgi:hypothetical protein
LKLVEYKGKIGSLERELGRSIEITNVTDEEYESWVNAERKFISDTIEMICTSLTKESSATREYAQASFDNLVALCDNLVRVIDLQNPRDRLDKD